MATESLSFDIWANDRASETFRRLGLSASNASGDVKTLGDRLDKLGTRVSTARVGLEGNKEAGAELDKLDVKLIRLGNKVADPNITVEGKIRALADIAAVDVAMDKLNKKYAEPSLITKAAGAGFFKPSLGGAALALSPALIPLAAGVAAGIGAITVSFGAATIGAGLFGLAARSVLTSASANLTKLQALELAVNKATTAATKKTALAAVAALKATFAPGYMALLDDLDKFKAAWTKTSQTIAVPALTSWLTALTAGMPLLLTATKPVADVFKNFADILKADFANPVIMNNLQGIAASFGRFSAGQLNLVGRAIGDMALGVYHLGHDFAASGANFASAGVWFANMGTAFLNWSKSAKARSDVQGFLAYLHNSGPVVKNILEDLGKVLPGIFAGASAAGQLELKALSTFLGFVAKLPKGWQAPLTEAAGAMLLLSKTGVVSIGLNIVKAAGFGAAGSAAGGAAAGAEGGVLSRLLGTGALRWAIRGGIAFAVADLVIKPVLQKIPPVTDPQARKDLAKTPSFIQRLSDAIGVTNLGGWIDEHISHPVRAWFEHTLPHIFDVARHAVAGVWDLMWNNTVGRMERGRHDIAAEFDMWRHNISATFDDIRHGAATAWDTMWNNTVGRVRRGVGDVVAWFRTLPGRAIGALEGLGTALYNFGHMMFTKFWNGMKSAWTFIASWVSRIAGWIKNLKGPIGKDLNLLYAEGHAIMHGLGRGIRQGFTQYVSRQLADVGSGVQRWAGTVRKALAMEGLSPLLLGNVLYQMQTESGGAPNAINLSDINAQMGDPSRGLMQVIGSTFAAYHWPGTSSNIYDPLANIAAALNYARHVYGPSLMSGGMGIGSGHGYAAGSWNVPFTGPATVHKGEMIVPARAAAAIRGGGGGNTYHIHINALVADRNAGRLAVEAIKQYEKGSGAGWRR